MHLPALSPRRLPDVARPGGRVHPNGATQLAGAAARTTRSRVMRILAAGVALASAGLLAWTPVASPAAGAAAGRATWDPATAGPPGGPVPYGFRPVSMTFVSASEGWVLGIAPCTYKPCTSVARTTDGGAAWVGIPAPRFLLARWPGQRGLSYLRFADPLDGFAFGSQLWVTHDGSATWHHVPLPGRMVK